MALLPPCLKPPKVISCRRIVISHFIANPYLRPMRQIARLALLCLLPALPAAAQSQDDVLTGTFRSGWQASDGSHMAALHLVMAQGWKTYWRSPGDAGIPPSFDWTGSENVRSVRFHWPRPEVFSLNGLNTIGYKGDLVLPIEVIPTDPALPVRLKAAVELGVCSDICLPASLALDDVLSGPGASDPLIHAALADQPLSAREAGVGGVGCQVEPIKDGLRVTGSFDLPKGAGGETVVFEPGLPGVWVSESATRREGGTLVATADMVPPQGKPFAMDRSMVVVTVISDNRAVEIRGCPAP